MSDLSYAVSCVNRLINVGKKGIHYSEEYWSKRFKNISLDVFPEDNDLIEFELVDDYYPFDPYAEFGS